MIALQVVITLELYVFTLELVFCETPSAGLRATERVDGFTTGGKYLSVPTSDME